MNESPLQLVADFAPLDRQAWRDVVDRDLRGQPFEKRLVTKLYEGLSVQPLYLPDDWPSQDDASGLPGQAPHSRGFAELVPERGWMVVQQYAHAAPERACESIRKEIASGVDAVLLQVAPSEGTLSSAGILVEGLADLEAALRDVPCERIPVHLSAGSHSFEYAALLVALWRRRNVSLLEASGAFNADPIGDFASTGTSESGLPSALARLGALAAFTASELPQVRSVRVSSAPYNAAGATAVQELAAVLSTGAAYLRQMEESGLSLEQAARQFVVELPMGCDQFLEIAKIRALRATWSALLGACGVGEESRRVPIHATTALRSLTKRDPWVNMLRTTVGCFAAAVGGADWVTVAPFDALLGEPSELGRRVARNTQVVLKEESHLAKVTDVAGGCWYVESLTEQLAQAAWKEFQSLEGSGGIIAGLRNGTIASSIAKVREERTLNAARRKDPITGVSEFASVAQSPLERENPDRTAIVEASSRRLEAARQAGVQSALEAARNATSNARFSALMDAALQGAKLGELASCSPSGPAEKCGALVEWRAASEFEALRDASDAHLARTGARPQVFLVNLGPVAQHTARATFTQNFFEAGGFQVIHGRGFQDAASATQAWRDNGAPLAVVCSSDELYESMVTSVAPALRAAGLPKLLLAGRPGGQEESYREAGVDGFIFIGCSVIDVLTESLRAQGALS